MPKYMFKQTTLKRVYKVFLQKGGSKRREAVAQMVEGMGGKLEAIYYAFGDTDVFGIIDMPDNISTTAVSLAVNAAGGATVKTIVLITPEEVDQAVKKSVSYRPPGQ